MSNHQCSRRQREGLRVSLVDRLLRLAINRALASRRVACLRRSGNWSDGWSSDGGPGRGPGSLRNHENG